MLIHTQILRVLMLKSLVNMTQPQGRNQKIFGGGTIFQFVEASVNCRVLSKKLAQKFDKVIYVIDRVIYFCR